MPPFRHLLTFVLVLLSTPLRAEEDVGRNLSVELNTARAVDGGCELSFLAFHGHSRDIGLAVFEAVIFDADGQVERLTLLDFGALPAGRPRVRQFVLREAQCDRIGKILINGATDCDGGGLENDACTKDLELRSRTEIEVIG